MDFDKILDHVGSFGRYQKVIYILSCLPAMLVSMNMLSYVFNSAVPKYRCYIPTCDNNASTYVESWVNFTTPSSPVKSASCSMFTSNNTLSSNDTCEPSDFNNNRTVACHKWIYDSSVYHSTVVTEWDLTCGDDWKPPLSGTIWMAGVIVGAAFFGYCSDKFGRRPTIMVSNLITCVTSFIVPFLPNYISFLIIRFFQAAASSGVYQTFVVLTLEFVGNSSRALCGIGINFAFAIGEILLGVVAYFFRDWRKMQLVLACPSAIFLLYYWVLPESVRWLISRERYNEANSVVRKMATFNKASVPSEEIEKNSSGNNSTNCSRDSLIPQKSVSVLELFRRKKLRWRTLNIFLNWFMNTIGYYGISMNSTNLGGDVYLNFVLTSLVELPAYVFCVLILDRIGRKIPLAGSMILGGVACILVMFVPNDPKYDWVSILLSLIGKFGCSAAFSIIYVFSAELFPTVLRNKGIGLSSFFAHIGGMLAPFIAHLSTYSKALPLVISGCSLVTSGILAFCLPESLHQRLPETVEDAELFGSDSYNVYRKNNEESEALLTSESSHFE